MEVLLNSHLIKLTQDSKCWGPVAGVFAVMSQKNRGGVTLNYNTEICHGERDNNRVGFGEEISSAANEPRKIVKLFPVMVSNERNQLRIQNQVSISSNS